MIAHKRDGKAHHAGDIRRLIDAYMQGHASDAQLSAWAMAVCWRGLDIEETVELTAALIESGDTVELPQLDGLHWVDKHSTGGVGDTTTIALAPLLAALGLGCAKMSGRGLGHTGGTLDKLESIPGFRVELDEREFIETLHDVHCAVVAQGPNLVPADGRLYALRDVTGTVPAPGLIAASVLSKKLAVSTEALVLDVKVGDGAFMKTLPEAQALAKLMVEVAGRYGRRLRCRLTSMEQPLGNSIGNALEVAEAMRVLRGDGPEALTEVVLTLAADLQELALGIDPVQGYERARLTLEDRSALAAAERWIAAQGGDPTVCRSDQRLPQAPFRTLVESPQAGNIERVSALALGEAACSLGAGRRQKGDAIDYSVGLVLQARVGDAVELGDPLCEIHAKDEASARLIMAEVEGAFQIGEESVSATPFLDVIG